MAQVPVKIATVETAGTRSIDSMAGSRKVRLDKTGKDSSQDGKTFAEALKKAVGGKLKVEKGGLQAGANGPGKAIRVSDAAQELTGRDDKSKKTIPPSKPGRVLPGAEILPFPALTAGRSANVIAAAQNAAPVQAEIQAFRSTSGKRDSGPETPKDKSEVSGRSGSAASTLRGGIHTAGLADLSGKARRVEVVDRKNTSFDPKSDSRTKSKNLKESIRSETGFKSSQTSESVRSDSRFAIAETDIDVPKRADGTSDNRSAAAELARKLDAQAGNEIVRQVKVVLTRADAGEVRINLRPDNLGRVRVEIHLDDNRLTGRIFVESAAAREAFRNALDGLQTRLVESGFGAADLELAWDDRSGGFAGHGDSPSQNGKDSRFAVQEFENMVSTAGREITVDGLVNMVV